MPECRLRTDGICNKFDVEMKPLCGKNCQVAIFALVRKMGELEEEGVVSEAKPQLINKRGLRLEAKYLIGGHWKKVAWVEDGSVHP